MSDSDIQKAEDKPLTGRIVKDRKDVISLTTLLAKNIMNQLPGFGILSGTATDYYQEKVAQKRHAEVMSCIDKLNNKLEGHEMKKEAIDYLETSLLFRLEEIIQKLGTNPDKGFDEVLSDFVAAALINIDVPPALKDLILSSLLSIDASDLKVFLAVDKQFKGLIKSGKTRGASFADLVAILKNENVNEAMISRSLQRLQSQDLIHPLNSNSASIQELPAQQELLEGVKSPQYYTQGGFVTAAFGRAFLRFLNLDS